MITGLLLLWLSAISALGQSAQDWYFREDHLTGADYIRLSADGTYTLTGRKHMGISVIESGRWDLPATRSSSCRRAGARNPTAVRTWTIVLRCA
jgi:hypothetical protein